MLASCLRNSGSLTLLLFLPAALATSNHNLPSAVLPSGCSPYALAAARALIDQPDMDALAIGALHTCSCGAGGIY